MDRELRDRWVAALRSGKYEQGKGGFYDPDTDKYCCLGVLCHIEGGRSYSLTDYSMVMPNGERKSGWFTDGEFGFKDSHKLTILNDSGMSFAEIADWIEANL